MTGQNFLAFDSFADAERSRSDFLYDATVRFVQRFASYTAAVNYNNVAGYNIGVNPLNTST